jgi:hypothetical protein
MHFAMLGFCISLLIGCTRESRFRYQDDLVKITERSIIQYLNVHASTDTEVLTIWGKDYLEVRGLNPCYLKIPGRPEILFVTGREYDNGQATVHLANTVSRRINDFPAYDSHIGADIGRTGSEFERVRKIEGEMLTIEAASTSMRHLYVIDLSGPRFIREEFDVTDSKGVNHHSLYEGGRLPK